MLTHSEELRRCEGLLLCAADALHEATVLGAGLPAFGSSAHAQLLGALEHGIARITPLMPERIEPPLAQRLWELAELEDGYVTALAFHGWQDDEPIDELPPLLTEFIDDQA